jgi:N-ethylmaleimide reductase
VPTDLNARYYGQRASRGGLLIAEATQVCPEGQGYPATPGIYSAEQVAGWCKVTEAVHARGGRIFLQLWHVGRISHSSLQPDGGAPWAPSAIRPRGMALTADGQQVPFETPRELTVEHIRELIADYRKGAGNAIAAGFGGVEVHGANGYLPNQFLEDGSNHRTDEYGGSIENRARFLLETVDEAIAVWGSDRVGVRLSPYGTFSDMHDSNPDSLYSYVLAELTSRHIAYLHLIEPRASEAGGSDKLNAAAPTVMPFGRKHFRGVLLSAGGFTRDSAMRAVDSGLTDAVVFGRLFIANPDLPERLRNGAALNRYDRSTFYGGAEKGYIDYPSLNAASELATR